MNALIPELVFDWSKSHVHQRVTIKNVPISATFNRMCSDITFIRQDVHRPFFGRQAFQNRSKNCWSICHTHITWFMCTRHERSEANSVRTWHAWVCCTYACFYDEQWLIDNYLFWLWWKHTLSGYIISTPNLLNVRHVACSCVAFIQICQCILEASIFYVSVIANNLLEIIKPITEHQYLSCNVFYRSK